MEARGERLEVVVGGDVRSGWGHNNGPYGNFVNVGWDKPTAKLPGGISVESTENNNWVKETRDALNFAHGWKVQVYVLRVFDGVSVTDCSHIVGRVTSSTGIVLLSARSRSNRQMDIHLRLRPLHMLQSMRNTRYVLLLGYTRHLMIFIGICVLFATQLGQKVTVQRSSL